MAPQAPSIDALARVAERLGLTLTTDDLESFLGLMAGSLTSYEVVERLAGAPAAAPPDRDPGHRPTADEDPLGAWYWKCSIPGRDSGRCRTRTDDRFVVSEVLYQLS
jgi:amidase